MAFEVTRVDEVIHFVRNNLGIALLPKSVARTRADNDPSLALRPVGEADMHRQVHLLTPRPHERSAACKRPGAACVAYPPSGGRAMTVGRNP
ncbi:hypothetical protein A5641_04010 [Mycobacterium sp. 1554424.7]|nr:hypothetical protein A5641_04010 [Mycobacterium sp. 1554424.7]